MLNVAGLGIFNQHLFVTLSTLFNKLKRSKKTGWRNWKEKYIHELIKLKQIKE